MKFPACIFFSWNPCHERVAGSAARPCPQPLLWWPLCCHIGLFSAAAAPGHSPGGVRREQSPAWESSLPPVLPCWKAGKGWSRTAVPSWHHSIPLSPGGHKYTAFSYLLMCKSSIKAWHSCGLLRNIRFQTHGEVKYPCDTIPECIMLHFRVF